MRGQQLKGHLDLLLLAVVRSGASHGYAIAQVLRSASGGTVDLQDGTIYPALRRLERAGLLESSWAEVEGRRRRLYALTRSGRTALARQQEDWQQVERAVSGVLSLLPP